MKPMMKCGHRANATDSTTGKPVCVICIGVVDGADVINDDFVDLSNREAICLSCGKSKQPSTDNLAFFEYRGEGSFAANLCKHCGTTKAAHDKRLATARNMACDNYEPNGPLTYDSYYCGCRGWN